MEFRAVPGWPGYEVSEDGQLRCLLKYRNKSPNTRWGTTNVHGYKVHVLTNKLKGVRKLVAAHRLVASAFLPPPQEGQTEVRHLDGDRANNHFQNLAWGSSKENSEDMVRHGRSARGEKNPQAKLTAQQVLDIFESLKTLSGAEVSSKFGVSEATVSRIRNGNHWAILS